MKQKKIRFKKLKCVCGSTDVKSELHYDSVFRCSECNFIGNEYDFESI